MKINKIAKIITNFYIIEHKDKYSINTFENKFFTFNKLKVTNDRLLTRFTYNNIKQINKFLNSIKPYDKYFDNDVIINKSIIKFVTNNKFEYNIKFEMLLDIHNMNKYKISYKDFMIIQKLSKSFGTIKSISFYKYYKIIVKMVFNKYEIYLII